MTSPPSPSGRHRAPAARQSRRLRNAGTDHEARHRATPRSRASRHARKAMPGFALPTAAAAALVLTATGATVVDAHPVSLDLTGTQEARQQELDRRAAAAAAAEARQLADQRQAAADARAAELRAASLAAARVALVEKRAAQVRAADALKAARRWVEPVDGCALSSPFGYRWGKLHAGNDFACGMDTPIKAMSTGTVVFAGYMGGYGNKVEVEYWDGTVSYYGHMDSIEVSEGDSVKPGDLVGYSGNTGRSTGPHLHLEIHPADGDPIDPLPWLKAHDLYTSLIGKPSGTATGTTTDTASD